MNQHDYVVMNVYKLVTGKQYQKWIKHLILLKSQRDQMNFIENNIFQNHQKRKPEKGYDETIQNKEEHVKRFLVISKVDHNLGDSFHNQESQGDTDEDDIHHRPNTSSF